MPSPDPDPPPPYFPVTFIGPNYTAARPINGNPALTIDRFTGEITGMLGSRTAVCTNHDFEPVPKG